MESHPLLTLTDIAYAAGGNAILDGVLLTVRPHDRLLILGPSGSGKTTLLHIMAGLLPPQSGKIILQGQDLWAMDETRREAFRTQTAGMVLQKIHVMPHLSAFDNLALVYGGLCRPVDEKAIAAHLAAVGLGGKEQQKAAKLSHGESQRLAIARAMLHKPQIVFADEPTSALDDANTEKIMTLLIEQADATGAALVVATHDARIKPHFDRHIVIENGKVLT